MRDTLTRRRLAHFQAAPLLLGSLIWLGCTTPELKPSGFLENYTALRRADDDKAVFYSDPTRPSGQPTHIVLIRDVLWQADEEVNEAVARELCQVFRERLRLKVLQQIEGVVVFDSVDDLASFQNRGGARLLVIDCAITRAAEGSGAGRYLVGYGLGDAKITVEATATAKEEGRRDLYQIVALARSNGNPHNGLNPRSLFSRYTLRLACDEAAAKLANHLSERISRPEKRWWEKRRPDAGTTLLVSARDPAPAPPGAAVFVDAPTTGPPAPMAKLPLPVTLMDAPARPGIENSSDVSNPGRSAIMTASYSAPLPIPRQALKPQLLAPVALGVGAQRSASPAPPLTLSVQAVSTLMPPNPGSVIVVVVDYSLGDAPAGPPVEMDASVRLVRRNQTLAFKHENRGRPTGVGQFRMLFQIPPNTPAGGCELEVLLRAAGSNVIRRAPIVIGASPPRIAHFPPSPPGHV